MGHKINVHINDNYLKPEDMLFVRVFPKCCSLNQSVLCFDWAEFTISISCTKGRRWVGHRCQKQSGQCINTGSNLPYTTIQKFGGLFPIKTCDAKCARVGYITK